MTKPPTDPLAETTLASEEVFDGVLLKVRRDRVRLPDGNTAVRECIRHPGAVLIRLGMIHPCVGYSDERIELFLARDLIEVGARPDADEFLEILHLGIDEAEQAARDGRITDAKTVCALFLGLPHLRP
ncbi:MAG: hypothetical protein LC667_11805 [Thioalkalivibrio sp.]|nr:hypothetical protein [Thioalkalivibrio sp.]